MTDAVAVFDHIALDYPKDMLALRMAHYLHFYGGGGRQMMESLQVALQHHETNDRYYGFLKGMQSFALEESGRYPEAEAAGLEALDINRKDIWAAHAVTHVYQMQSRFEEAIPFIDSLLPEWSSANNFVYHLHWHKALLHIGLGNLDQALNVYDETLVKPLADDFYLDVCNATSLLWRLEMSGVQVGRSLGSAARTFKESCPGRRTCLHQPALPDSACNTGGYKNGKGWPGSFSPLVKCENQPGNCG